VKALQLRPALDTEAPIKALKGARNLSKAFRVIESSDRPASPELIEEPVADNKVALAAQVGGDGGC